LDATTRLAVTEVADERAVVNGPEGEPPDWDAVDWRQAEEDVRRLRRRIFAASKAGDLKKVRNLQKLMFRSRASALLSVRRVTELNAGRLTAGVDGKVVAGSQPKAEWASWAQNRSRSWTPKPVRRVYVPKANGKQRPIGIPMDLGQCAASVKFLIRDRAGQFTGSFDAVFTAAGARILASPPQAPRANAVCERMIGTLRRELFDRLLIVNEHHLRRVLTGYLRHYNTARPHRALGQLAPAQAPTRPPQINLAGHRIRRKQILGGLTSEYQIAA